MAHRELANFSKRGSTTYAKNTTWEKQSQNMKNSTKGGFSFRAIILITNILLKKKKNQQLPKGSFHSGSRKGNKQQKGNNHQNKVFGKK